MKYFLHWCLVYHFRPLSNTDWICCILNVTGDQNGVTQQPFHNPAKYKPNMCPTGFPIFWNNPNSTQPKVGFDTKMTLHTTHHHKLNVSNISAVIDPIWPNFKGRFLGSTTTTIPSSTTTKKQQYLSYHWPNLDDILKLSFWINNNNYIVKNNKNKNKTRRTTTT